MQSTWSASWKSSGFTTTKVAFTSRSQAARQENDPANRHLLMQFLITTVGGSIAADCSRCQSQLNYEFAINRPTSLRAPWQNGYVERLIGSIRRECTDHLIVVNAGHLQRILAKYATYYNGVRSHVSLGKDAPDTRLIERFGDIVAHPIRGGLHHRYARI